MSYCISHFPHGKVVKYWRNNTYGKFLCTEICAQSPINSDDLTPYLTYVWYENTWYLFQCCGSGCLSRIPDPNFFHPGSEFFPSQIPDLQQRIKICFKALGNMILVVLHPGSRGVKKAPDPGSATLTYSVNVNSTHLWVRVWRGCWNEAWAGSCPPPLLLLPALHNTQNTSGIHQLTRKKPSPKCRLYWCIIGSCLPPRLLPLLPALHNTHNTSGIHQITIKTPNPICRLYWRLIEFIHSQSCWNFRPLLWPSAPLTFSPVHLSPPPPPCLNKYRSIQGEGIGLWGEHMQELYNLCIWPDFEPTKLLPFFIPNQKPRGGGASDR